MNPVGEYRSILAMTSTRAMANRVRILVQVLATIAGIHLAIVGLVIGDFPMGIEEWFWVLGSTLVLWFVYLPLEFALVVMTSVLIGAAWEVVWREWGKAPAPTGGEIALPILLCGVIATTVILIARLVAYRRGVRSISGMLISAALALAGIAFFVWEGSTPRSLGLQMLAAAVFAPLGANILLFLDNRRGTPSLKELLGGLWIFTYLTGAQVVLVGFVLPFALLATREKWGLIRRQGSNGMRFMFDSFPYGRLERVGVDAEAFEPPAIIVSNHQSSVDIPLILSLPADIRLLTSRRVWRSPVLGVGARLLGHLPVESGQPEVTFGRCRERLAQGASVHGFPEGTRSEGAFPKRFHRGTFEIACELRTDVLPVVLVNSRSCVARDGFWVGDFRMCVRALPRITPETFDYDLGSNAMRKHVQALVRDAIDEDNRRLFSELGYLQSQIRGLYRYQSRKTLARVRRELASAREWLGLANGLRDRRRVLIVEAGFGTLAHALSLLNLRAKCVGALASPDQLTVATRSAASNESLTFVSESQRPPLEQFDAVVLGKDLSDATELRSELAAAGFSAHAEYSELYESSVGASA